MALPAIAGISLGATAVGSIFGAIGAGQQASAQAANAQYQAAVARNNQLIAERNAGAAIQAGEAQATDVSLRGAAQLGRIRAGQAANNIDVNTGSAVDVQAAQRGMTALDTSRVMNRAQREAYGYRAQASNYGAQAQLEQAQAGQAQAAGRLGIMSSLVSGAGELSNRFLWMQQNAGPASGLSSSDLFTLPYAF